MRPESYRVLACIGLVAQLAHVAGLVILARAINRALAHAAAAVEGDISGVTRALASAGPGLRITNLIGLAGFVLLLVAVMKGRARARWIFWPGLLASLFYVLLPIAVLLLLRVGGLPLGLIPGLVGLVHFLGHRQEYRSP